MGSLWALSVTRRFALPPPPPPPPHVCASSLQLADDDDSAVHVSHAPQLHTTNCSVPPLLLLLLGHDDDKRPDTNPGGLLRSVPPPHACKPNPGSSICGSEGCFILKITHNRSRSVSRSYACSGFHNFHDFITTVIIVWIVQGVRCVFARLTTFVRITA